MDILGNTLELVMAEKAGIIKAGVPVISAVEQPEAIWSVIEQIAKARKQRFIPWRSIYVDRIEYRARSSKLPV